MGYGHLLYYIYFKTWNDLETRLDEKPYDTERKEKFEKREYSDLVCNVVH